jgi:hypothetical protein
MIEVAAADDAHTLGEFARLPETIYRAHGLRAPATPAHTLAMLRHDTPFTEGRRLMPFLARDSGRAVARAAALVDERYIAHWGERLGHVVLFEAASNAAAATRHLMDRAAECLRAQGCVAVRTGYGSFEPGFVIDAYAHVLPGCGATTCPTTTPS